jgi:polyisoprenoid-binding protein YceI
VRYELVPERSTLTVQATSSIHPIHTTVSVSGWIEITYDATGAVDGTQPPGGLVQLDISAMRSGNPLIDREAERRLDIRRYPTVTGELTRLEATKEDGRFDAAGDLTFHGATRPIEGRLRIVRHDDELALSGSTRIDVTDFGVQPPSLLVVKVHKVVTVELAAVGRESLG